MIKYELSIECFKCKYDDTIICKGFRLPFRCPSCGSKNVLVLGNELTDGIITGTVWSDGTIEKINDCNIQEEKHLQYKKQPPKPTITCPYCNSTDCKKIGVISRGMSFGLFGFGSGKLGKQWHCNNCSSDF